MAQNETGQERSESATPKRRQKAFDEGQVAKSQELTGAIVLLTGMGMLAAGVSEGIMGALIALLTRIGEVIRESAALDNQRLLTTLSGAGRTGVSGAMPFVVGVGMAALVTNALQARGVVSVHPIKPKATHISPLTGLKRMFSAQSAFTLVKSVLKLAALGAVTYVVVKGAWDEVLSLGLLTPSEIGSGIGGLALRLGAVVSVAFLVVATADFFFQLYQHERKMRMTKHEVTQEMKETEGDPLIKSRLKSLAMNMRRTRMMSDVPDADVVVTNPTRIAVALKYDPASAGAPVVVAMGARKIARRIREIALASGVPVIENKPLAQVLLATARVGEPIPSALYAAVAEVLAFVFRQDRRAAKAVVR